MSFDECVSNTVFDRIPEYNQIILDLGKGNLNGKFNLNNRKSKLGHSLKDILFDELNDELSYFVLFMDSKNASNYVKFLLDLNNFKITNKNIKYECLEEKENLTYFESNYKNFVQDVMSLFEKYISKGAKYSIDLDDDLVTDIIRKICPEKNEKVKPNCFDQAKDHVFKILEQFYDQYLVSEYHCKYLKSILETKSLSLSDFLYDDFAVVFFLEYLEQENVSCLLKFWIQADNFTRNLQQLINSDSQKKYETLFKQWQNDAMIIYDNYISLQANNALGFDKLVRRQVELNICQIGENENLEYLINDYSNCFYIPLLIVYTILDKSYFTKFLHSSMYNKYVNEILLNSQFETKPKTSQRTETKAKNFVKPNEPLWSNPLSSNMYIGKIDKTGRFIRYLNSQSRVNNEKVMDKSPIENEDDIWNLYDNSIEDFGATNKPDSDMFGLKNKLDKLINRIPLNLRSSPKFSEDDYELAEQIAANLVNEVIQVNQSI